MEIANNFEYLLSDYPKPKIVRSSKTPFRINVLRVGFQTLGKMFPKTGAELAFKLFTTPNTKANHKVSDPILEKARIFEFMYGKFLLKGYEWGEGDKVVLLVHGWRSRGTALRSFVPGLVKQGYRVVAFDGPAHGDSPGKRTTLPQFSGAVKAIIRHIGGAEGIITHSFGGASTVFALKDKEDQILIDKLVLIASPSSLEYMADHFLGYIKAPDAIIAKFYKILENRIGISLTEAQVSKFNDDIQVNSTLLVHDKKDDAVPFSEAESVFKEWDNTRLLATDGYGHFQLMKNPDVVERVVGFFGKAKK